MSLIKLLYIILHYEAWTDHEESVNRTFYIITLLVSSIIGLFIHGLFSFYGANTQWIFTYILSILFSCYVCYYFIIEHLQKQFTIDGLDKYYYNFGKYNIFVKTILFLLLMGLIIISALIVRNILSYLDHR